MSRQNTEVVQRWLLSFDSDADAFRATLHPDIEWFPFEDNHSPSYGIAGAMRVREHWLESWEDMSAELEEIVETRDGMVASVYVKARGKSSGVEVEVRLHLHFKIRDGRIVYIYEHQDKAEALEAANQRVQDKKRTRLE
jgi:ketosteroid isomerase-like protein